MADYLTRTNVLRPLAAGGHVRIEQLMDDSTVQAYPIGTKYEEDTRTFRYCKAGAAQGGLLRGAINGHIVPGDTGSPGFEGALNVDAVAGQTVLQVADTEATHTKNYYSGGYMVVFNSTVPQYTNHYILSSTASDGATVNFTISRGLDQACTTSFGVTLYPSPYSNILAAGGVAATYESFVCVPLGIVASGSYFWGQTAGPTWVTAHGVTWPGYGTKNRDVYFHQDGTIDGAATAGVGTTSPQRAGYLLSPSATATYGDAFIQLQLE